MEAVIAWITKANQWLNDQVWGWPMMILILGTGIWLTICTRAMLVPFMSLLFIVIAIIAIAINFKAMAGGFGGYLFGDVIKKGMARGVFSNEAGLGSSVIAHSASETREPVKQGLWGIFEVFFDTFIICTLSALVFLTTFINNGQIETFTKKTSDAAASISAFSTNFGLLGTIIIAVILPLFAFTTILAWSYYGEKAVEFCFAPLKEKGKKTAVLIFKLIYLVMIIAAAVIESDLLWNISDTANGLMALPNLVAVVLLSGKVVKITKNYYARKKGETVEPMLSAYPEQNREFTEDIQNEE